jgi:hypothetical protein
MISPRGHDDDDDDDLLYLYLFPKICAVFSSILFL